jgi:hypothetical protein
MYARGYAIGPMIGGGLFELSGADLAYFVSAAFVGPGAADLHRKTRLPATTLPAE